MTKAILKPKVLAYTNNWQADEYTIDGSPVIDLKKVRVDGEEFEVTKREVSVQYNDMGHVYNGTSMHYFVTVTPNGPTGKPMKGLATSIDLNTIVNKMAIEPIDYITAAEAAQSPKADCLEIWEDFKTTMQKYPENNFPNTNISNEIKTMLEYAWNRGFKRGFNTAVEAK